MSRQKRPNQTVANDAEPSRRTLARMARVGRTVEVKSLDATQVLEAADTAEHLAEALREQCWFDDKAASLSSHICDRLCS